MKEVSDVRILLPLLLPYLLYPIGAGAILRLFRGPLRTQLFAIFNVIGAYVTTVAILVSPVPFQPGLMASACKISALVFGIYLIFVTSSYAMLRRSVSGTPLARFGAFALPIVQLVLIKYVPFVDHLFGFTLHPLELSHVAPLFLGISYVTFRLTYLVQEVSNNVVQLPSLFEYVAFAFYVPALSVGPINTYSRFSTFLGPPDRTKLPVGISMGRILVGLWKYLVVANVLGTLTYSGLLLDGHPHNIIDLVVAIFAYSIFLYCNFSGLCDIAIGVSGLLGIEVMENFDRPFLARNFQEFWSRWHISLSNWMRDLIFTPLVKVLVRAWGPKKINQAIALSIMVVFLTVGVWHGAGFNFVLFGLSQGLGVATVHYCTAFMKLRLGRDGFSRYKSNAIYRWIGSGATYLYFSLTLFLFANTTSDMARIVQALRGR